MKRIIIVSAFLASAKILTACQPYETISAPSPCSEQWFQWVETQVLSGDDQGHGPDIQSDEWKSVMEFKLGIRGNKNIPDRNSSEWCDFIDQHIENRDI